MFQDDEDEYKILLMNRVYDAIKTSLRALGKPYDISMVEFYATSAIDSLIVSIKEYGKKKEETQ